MNNPKQRKTERADGFVLVSAVVLLLVFAILIGIVLTISYASLARSVKNNSEKQAYSTARFVAEAIAADLTREESSLLKESVFSSLNQSGDTLTVTSVAYNGAEGNVGDCDVLLTREEKDGLDTLLITATAQVANAEKNISLRLEYHFGEGGAGDYFGQLVLNGSSVSGTKTPVFNGISTSPTTDLFISDVYVTQLSVDITSNGSTPLIKGNVYAEVPFILGSRYYGTPESHVHGSIISDANITTNHNSTVGPHTGCCDAPIKPSEIFSLATVRLNNEAVVYCPILAQTVTTYNETIINNSISGNTVTIRDNSIVTGSITANTLVIQNNTIVTGNVHAKSLVLRDNGIVNGNVTAESVTIRNGGKIFGSATVKTISSVSASKNPMITGNLTSQNAIPSTIKVGGTKSSGITYTAESTPVSLDLFVSRLPEKTPPPVLPELEDHMDEAVQFNGQSTNYGKTDGSSSFIIVEGDWSNIGLKTQGEGSLYFYIMDGANFNLGDNKTLRQTNPNIYFIVEPGGVFSRSNKQAEDNANRSQYKDFYGYIYGKEGSDVYLGRGTSIYGGIYAANAKFGIDVSIHHVPSTGGSSGGGAAWVGEGATALTILQFER